MKKFKIKWYKRGGKAYSGYLGEEVRKFSDRAAVNYAITYLHVMCMLTDKTGYYKITVA